MQTYNPVELKISVVGGVVLLLIILLSMCFYVPLIIGLWHVRATNGWSGLVCATGLELCQILLLISARQGLKG